MTQRHYTLNPAMTAIAAVIALSSTPSFAQSTETPDPIVETTPAPASSSPDPLAPDVVTTTSTPEPVASETTVAPAPAARTAARTSRPATPTRNSTATRARAAAPTDADVPGTANTASLAAPAPVDPLLIPPELAAPAPISAPTDPALETAPVAIDQMSMEQALPFVGAAGLGLLGLAGAGIVMRRRRRRREDAIEEAKWQHIAAAPDDAFGSHPAPVAAVELVRAPGFVRNSASEPVAAASTATAARKLPEGFDTSGFGRHVQAAYAGPTPGNPSASLKRRLTVGHFLDQKEAAAGHAAPARGAAAPTPAPARPAVQPAWAARGDSDFMFRRDSKLPSLKSVHQK